MEEFFKLENFDLYKEGNCREIKKEKVGLPNSQKAYQNLQKYRRKGNIDVEYKQELMEIISKEYENIN